VRDVDNTRNTIPDPSWAGVSYWSTHCGYMHTLPSNVTLCWFLGSATNKRDWRAAHCTRRAVGGVLCVS